MRFDKHFLGAMILGIGMAGAVCAQPADAPAAAEPVRVAELIREVESREDMMARLEAKPLFEFTEQEVDAYLGYLQETEPNLHARVVKLGRKNIGQPYELYLLGEFPFETYDSQPLYCIEKSDCVVFSEHAYAMALSHDWPSFFAMLQRIRYKNGEIGVVTRNHYTETDWDINNSWLVKDMSKELAGDKVATYQMKVDRTKFLKNRYKIDRDIPVVNHTESYVPVEMIPEIESQLRSGDFVNVIVGKGDGYWATHVGLIAIGEDGTVNFLHSSPPQVREEPLAAYIERSLKRADEADANGKPIARLYGFKFLRLQDDPIANLAAIDGPGQVRVTIAGQ